MPAAARSGRATTSPSSQAEPARAQSQGPRGRTDLRAAQQSTDASAPDPAVRSRPAGASAVGMLGIGDVIARLKPEFPTISVSKVRFLETEGLVTPSRTASKYRKFTLADVERLRYVLQAQSEHYLPLKVIKEHLAALDRGLEVASPMGAPRAPRALVTTPGMPDAEAFSADRGSVLFTRAEVLAETGLSEELFDRLHDGGMITATRANLYDADCLAVADAVAGLAEYGFDARHLRAFKTAADREAGLVEQVVAPLRAQREPESQVRAAEAARELAARSVRLHAALVRRALPDDLKR